MGNTFGDYEAVCDNCGWHKKLRESQSSGLKLGDLLFRSEDPNSNRCNRCKRTVMRVTKVPHRSTIQVPTGFWKVPDA
jgi:hypothetical protein